MNIYTFEEIRPAPKDLVWFQLVENNSGLGVVYFGYVTDTVFRPGGEVTVTFQEAGGRVLKSVGHVSMLYWAKYEDLQSQYNVQHEKAVMADLDTISDSENLQEKVEQAEEIMQEALEWIDEMPFKKVHRRVRDLMHQFIYGGQYRIDEKEY